MPRTEMYQNLTLEKLICPICRGILIEPVTLPCKHELCLECFDSSMEMANLTCPMCRKRFGAWMRRERIKEGNLVNSDLWKHIQTNYADYVAMKQRGEDEFLENVLMIAGPAPVRISKPGEIREEFETSQAVLEGAMRAKQEAEDKASAELIKKLKEEEEDSLNKCRKVEDELWTKEIQTRRTEKEKPKEEDPEHDGQENNKGPHVTGSAAAVGGPVDKPALPQEIQNQTDEKEQGEQPSDVLCFSKVKPLQGNSRSNCAQTCASEAKIKALSQELEILKQEMQMRQMRREDEDHMLEEDYEDRGDHGHKETANKAGRKNQKRAFMDPNAKKVMTPEAFELQSADYAANPISQLINVEASEECMQLNPDNPSIFIKKDALKKFIEDFGNSSLSVRLCELMKLIILEDVFPFISLEGDGQRQKYKLAPMNQEAKKAICGYFGKDVEACKPSLRHLSKFLVSTRSLIYIKKADEASGGAP